MNLQGPISVVLRRLLLLALSLPLANAAVAQTSLTGSATLNKANETYKLDADVVTAGTAFSITAAGVIFDLNGHTITYGSSATSTSFGIQVRASNVTIKNGTIIQGSQKSSGSNAIDISGQSADVSYLVLETSGEDANGISALNADSSTFHHIFATSTAPSNGTGVTPTGIYVQARNRAGLSIHDNILIGSTRGIWLEFLGNNVWPNMPTQSVIYSNLITPDRIFGAKAPYGILVAQSSNLDIYDNQIVTKQGRGVILDGYYDGSPIGSVRNLVHNNLIDIQYSPNPRSGQGQYPEEQPFGVRVRFSSGDNTVSDNVIIVNNLLNDYVYGVYVGSGTADPAAKNIIVTGNTVIARGKTANYAMCFYMNYSQSISVTDNRYQCAGKDLYYGWTGLNNVASLTYTGNAALTPPTAKPTPPTNLRARRFLDKVVLEWDPSPSAGTYEYRVYRNGVLISSSVNNSSGNIGGRFFVDTPGGSVAAGNPVYTVRAVSLAATNTLTGPESVDSAGLNYSKAEFAWGGTPPATATRPAAPQNFTVQ